MNKYSKITFAALLTLFVIISACQDDIVIPPQPTLEGSYEGLYRVITGYQNPSAETTMSTIEMLFSDESYFFNSENVPDAFCDPRGDYLLSANTIELDETNRNCTQIAKERDNPRGTFSIRRPGDSVIMTQLLEPDTLKQFLLIRK
ncbi:MAG TPA: hypothetical protein VHP63_07085 [candidate division Zixibacteria bacterium]|nr:hypothetical protein [candidate division Zixibacteria bacterium]